MAEVCDLLRAVLVFPMFLVTSAALWFTSINNMNSEISKKDNCKRSTGNTLSDCRPKDLSTMKHISRILLYLYMFYSILFNIIVNY